jgi:histidine triad (HIT) family protein
MVCYFREEENGLECIEGMNRRMQDFKKPSRLRVFLDKHTLIHIWVVRLLRLLSSRSTCPFCDIVQGKAPGRVLYQDDLVTAFWDAHPSTSIHILIVSNRHIESMNELQPGDLSLIGHFFTIAGRLAEKENLVDDGYQLMINTGFDAGQTVFHLHMHLRDMESL